MRVTDNLKGFGWSMWIKPLLPYWSVWLAPRPRPSDRLSALDGARMVPGIHAIPTGLSCRLPADAKTPTGPSVPA